MNAHGDTRKSLMTLCGAIEADFALRALKRAALDEPRFLEYSVTQARWAQWTVRQCLHRERSNMLKLMAVANKGAESGEASAAKSQELAADIERARWCVWVLEKQEMAGEEALDALYKESKQIDLRIADAQKRVESVGGRAALEAAMGDAARRVFRAIDANRGKENVASALYI